MTNERDALISKYDLARKTEGEITARHEPLLKAKQSARDAARQALADAETAFRQADHEQRAELSAAYRITAGIERQLELSVPGEVTEALARLDAAADRIREMSEIDAEERERLRSLLALRSEVTDLHLLPSNALRIRLGRIRNAINPREVEMLV